MSVREENGKRFRLSYVALTPTQKLEKSTVEGKTEL